MPLLTASNLGSQGITLNFDGSHPALMVSAGNLKLNNNAITVNGSLLAVSATPYTIISGSQKYQWLSVSQRHRHGSHRRNGNDFREW